MDSWNLRNEFLRTIEQWYFVLGSILLGGLLGYVFTFLMPPQYQATADLYVGIDVVRVNEMEYLIPLAKEEPLNLDDYKNWQLKQLSDILYLDSVLDITLESLREQDPEWQGITSDILRKSTNIYWYDTGIWRLEVNHGNRNLAEMAVISWLETGYAKISDLLIASEEATVLDFDLQIIKKASAVQKAQIARLEAFLNSSDEWLSDLDALSQK